MPLYSVKYTNVFEKFYFNEFEKVKEYVLFMLNKKAKINKMHTGIINKLEVLSIANKLKIQTPQTLISSKKEKILSYFGNNKIINKAICENNAKLNNEEVVYKVNQVNLDNFKLDNKLFLFQNEIEKAFEIRVFHLLGKNYSMAIFSQSNEETKLDFRTYNLSKPNRFVPFKLPQNIETKINKLMKITNHNSVSIDMIYTTDNKYVFLEVNPIGQFDMTSTPCNYNLNYEIAKKLM